jgi:hypothetical protein
VAKSIMDARPTVLSYCHPADAISTILFFYNYSSCYFSEFPCRSGSVTSQIESIMYLLYQHNMHTASISTMCTFELGSVYAFPVFVMLMGFTERFKAYWSKFFDYFNRNLLCLQVVHIPTVDLQIFLCWQTDRRTDKTDCITPCACVRVVNPW